MNKKDGQKSVAGAVFNVLSGTLFSRVTGMAREIVMATYFGADPLVATFWISFRMIFMLRKVLGGNVLGTAFIPYFEYLRSQDPNRAAFFFRRFFKFFVSFSVSFTLLIEVGLFHRYRALNYSSDVLLLTMIMLPAGIFLLFYTVNAALLHCEKKFLGVGLAPSLVNLLWIASVIINRNVPPRVGIIRIAIIITCGFVLEWFVTVPGVQKFLSQWKTRPQKIDSIKKVLAPLSLGLLNSAVFQINTMSDMFIAKYINPIGPLYLWYAARIQQLPIHLFGLGVFTVLLPAISRCVQKKDDEKGSELLSFALNLTISVMIIMTTGLFLLALPGVRMLYEHGQFSKDAVQAIVKVLWGYGGSIIPMALSALVSVLFYADRKYTVPLLIGVVTALSNICLSFFFGNFFHNVYGVSLATSIVSWVQLYLLWTYSGKRLDAYKGILSATFSRALKVLFTTLVAALVTVGINFLTHTTNVIWVHSLTSKEAFSISAVYSQCFAFCSESGIFLAFLFIFAKLFGTEDLLNLTSFDYWRGQGGVLRRNEQLVEEQES
ncbi:lipid II flippase MurJ [Chlamydiifrater phoenicopteri]|uniref:lipid II flippase MurJ n=1 Tax=Chlamydiifrater phoenicopteri TaxID=2681469 RepID=UPI001BD03420|nr:murein biosynthesis integral membrane protein MurJ [Chlamydiifrater phoenicopteri]